MIDLHTHSRYSDGSDSPGDLARLAASTGLSAIALTDHDTTMGLGEMADACASLGVELVPGVEVSLKDQEFVRSRGGEAPAPISIHLLGYFVPMDPDHPFQQRLVGLRDDRSDRNQRLIERLNELGFSGVNMETLSAAAGGVDNIGRPHFARVMIDTHPEIVGPDDDDTWARVFTDWLGVGGLAYISKAHTTIEEFVASGRDAGVVFSIAHPLVNYVIPGQDPATVIPAVLGSLKDRGIMCVEALYGGTDAPTRALMVKLTRDAGMIPTGGSDYHGSFKRGVALGRGRSSDLRIDDSTLVELKKARG